MLKALLSLSALLLACGGDAKPAAEPTSSSATASGAEARDATIQPLGGWTKLGERSLESDGQKNSVRASADEGRFSSVRFVIKHGTLEITSVAITYGDGTTFSSPLRLPFGKGVTSRALDLPGEKRVIRQVDFAYTSRSTNGRSAQLEIWAQ